MAYRAPRFSHVHAIRDAGASAIIVSDTAHADFPKENLIDDRASTRFMWSASVVDPTIDIDLGAGFVTGLERLIIPANHNIESITVLDDDNLGFTSPATLHAADTGINAGTLYDSGPFDTGNSTQRYIRIQINGTAKFYLPQLYLTKIVTLTIGPTLADALDSARSNFTRLEQESGVSPSVQKGPDQRVLDYTYEFALSGADLTAMEAFIADVGMHRPFFVDPASFSTPPETDEPVLWMKFLEQPESRYFVDVPMNEARRKTFRLRLIESVD